jgi:hypothetical protein
VLVSHVLVHALYANVGLEKDIKEDSHGVGESFLELRGAPSVARSFHNQLHASLAASLVAPCFVTFFQFSAGITFCVIPPTRRTRKRR